MSLALISALRLTRHSTISFLPSFTAMCRGVLWLREEDKSLNIFQIKLASMIYSLVPDTEGKGKEMPGVCCVHMHVNFQTALLHKAPWDTQFLPFWRCLPLTTHWVDDRQGESDESTQLFTCMNLSMHAFVHSTTKCYIMMKSFLWSQLIASNKTMSALIVKVISITFLQICLMWLTGSIALLCYVPFTR